MKPLLTKALDVIFPPQCLKCDTQVDRYGTLCQPCWQQVSFISAPFCHACGLPFEYAIGDGALCGDCIHELPPFAQARSAIRYDEHGKSLVLKLKYADQTQLARIYGPWLARCGQELLQNADVIVPVPLHYWRFVGRRYNQSALLADSVKQCTGLPVIHDALHRTRPTKPQAGLTRKQRLDNVKGAFEINTRWQDEIKGKSVVLIDDVMTTYATARHCAKALLDAGATRVDVLTLARATG